MRNRSVRIGADTHQELKRLAAALGTTVGDTVALAVRSLRQERMGTQLQADLTDEEVDWLEADLV